MVTTAFAIFFARPELESELCEIARAFDVSDTDVEAAYIIATRALRKRQTQIAEAWVVVQMSPQMEQEARCLEELILYAVSHNEPRLLAGLLDRPFREFWSAFEACIAENAPKDADTANEPQASELAVGFYFHDPKIACRLFAAYLEGFYLDKDIIGQLSSTIMDRAPEEESEKKSEDWLTALIQTNSY